MSFLTNLTRCWLTRSFKPFIFTDEYDEQLNCIDTENLGLYVHIPFCRSICNFCPYCKTVYSEAVCNTYIDALLNEIEMTGRNLKEKKKTTSLYFGGGTPALAVNRIKEITDTLKKYFIITEGVGVELHPEDVKVPVLKKLREAGVTKISIGIQSFQDKYQSILGRKAVDVDSMEEALHEVPFETVSMDFIFALPDQTYQDLKSDIETAFSSGANHVAIYPFIDFTFTQSRVKAMSDDEKKKLLYSITDYCGGKGYERNSIWTFSKEHNASYSSMTRDNFLGFGCSAATLLKEQFKINTFSVEEYCKRINSGKPATSLTIRFTMRQRMVYYLFWTAYSMEVSENDFYKFFGVPLKKVYGFEIKIAQLLGFVTENKGIYRMTAKGAFYYHYYENFYTLSYIDRMWRIMRKEAFPKEIRL